MTLSDFNRQPFARQMAVVISTGTFLAQRHGRALEVNLFHLPGHFFVEVYIHTAPHQLLQVRAFTGSEDLAAYANLVRLPAEWLSNP